MTLGCPDIKITASHAYTSTGSWSWTHSHSAQVSLLPYKPFKLVLFHVPAISPGAVVLRDVERKEKVSWHGSLGWFTNQHAAWHWNSTTVPFQCTSHPHTSAGACKSLAFCSNNNVRWCFLKHTAFVLQMDKLRYGEVKQLLVGSMCRSRNRLGGSLRGLLVITPLLRSLNHIPSV